MLERLLEYSIVGLTGVIVGLMIWVIIRELLRNLKNSEKDFRGQIIENLFRGWLHQEPEEQRKTCEKIKAMGPATQLEPYFFDSFDASSSQEKEKLRALYELLGIQDYLRLTLMESPNIDRREESIFKMGRVGEVNDLLFLLDLYLDTQEDERIRQCSTEVIFELAEPLLNKSTAAANMALLIRLLDIPNVPLQEHLVHIFSSMPYPLEDVLPHFVTIRTDAGKVAAIRILAEWNRAELSQLLYDFIDDVNVSVRRSAIELLGRWQDQAILLKLLKHLGDPDPLVRLATVEAVSGFKLPAIQKRLLKRANDPSVTVRAKIFWTLAIQGYNEAFPVLIEELKESSFRKEFFIQLSHEKRSYLQDFFNFLGLDYRIFFKRFGWGDFDRCYEAFLATAEESQEPHLRMKALEALTLWNLDGAMLILQGVVTTDPDHEVQAFAKKLMARLKPGREAQ